MKQILLAFILLFTFVIQANDVKAQIKPKFGVRLVFNFETYRYSKDEDDSRSPRISLLGVYAVVPIHETFSLQPEVLATHRGAEINNMAIELSYIQIPVFARIDFANGSLLSPHVYLGPYIAFNLSTEKNPSNLSNPPPFAIIPSVEEDIRPADEIVNDVLYGLAVGLGVDISSFSFGIRFSQSIAKTFEVEDGRNTAISLLAAYHF